MGDRSLDDFLDGDADPDDHGPDDAERDAADGTSDVDDDSADGEPDGDGAARVDPSTVDPAVSTYAWRGDGGSCAACDETVERRWRSDDGLVCPDCKEW